MRRTERGRHNDVVAGEAPATVTDRPASPIDPLLELPSRLEHAAGDRTGGVVIGRLVGFDARQQPLVTYDGQPGTAALFAPAATPLDPAHVGEQILLAFERGDPSRPFVIGRLGSRPEEARPAPPVNVDVEADGERLTITAGTQLVLRCGKASITLTAAGKVLIEGAYVSTRSSGALRLKGGSIQLN